MENTDAWIQCPDCGVHVLSNILRDKDLPHIKGKLAEHKCSSHLTVEE